MCSVRRDLYRIAAVLSLLVIWTTPCLAQLPTFDTAAERDTFLEARRTELQQQDFSLKGLKVRVEERDYSTRESAVLRDAEGRALRDPQQVRSVPQQQPPADPGTRFEGPLPEKGPQSPTVGPFVVNSGWDSADNFHGDGTCFTGWTLPNSDIECTLRAAIEEANATGGPEGIEIVFDILAPPGGLPQGYDATFDLWKITPNTFRSVANGRLPPITRANVHIHGETQSGAPGFFDAQCGQLTAGNLHRMKVLIDGSLVTTGTPTEGLIEFAAGADGGSVRGLAVGNAEDRGVKIDAIGVNVECVHVGTTWSGSVQAQNFVGVGIYADEVSVRNSVLSGNTQPGIEIAAGADRAVIEGSLIGTNTDGTAALGNQTGVSVSIGNDVRIGGIDPHTWNVISGNGTDAISISSPNQRTIIEGNRIGTNLAGDLAIANLRGVGDFGTETRIGGLAPTAGNLISGNTNAGLALYGDLTIVEGNLIGTNLAGTGAIPNDDGILCDADQARIGGTDPEARNVISGNSDDGIELVDSDNTVLGNYIGTDITGNTARPNFFGVFVNGPDNVIGGLDPGAGNVISGNTGSGVLVQALAPVTDVSGTRIQGNRIGTNAAGTSTVPNGDHGVHDINMDSGPLRWTEIRNNQISGNTDSGIRTEHTSTRIQGNAIGVDVSGTVAIPNGDSGVMVIGDDVVIGGETLDDRNIISGNTGSAEVLIEAFADGTLVQGNYIGTDATGMAPLFSNASVVDNGTNTRIGVSSEQARNVIANSVWLNGTNSAVGYDYIGTNAHGMAPIGSAGDGIVDQAASSHLFNNVISGNALSGILVNGSSTDCTIWSNFIGTDADGAGPVPNGYWGINDLGAGTAIGDVNSALGNRIAFNTLDGVSLSLNPTTTAILGNSIYANGELGIDIAGGTEGPFGETFNDAGDADSGPNQFQNYPVLTSLVSDGVTTLVDLTLNSTPDQPFRIELFTNTVADASGYGEGQTFAWTTNVFTNSLGNAVLSSVPVSSSLLPIGSVVTATATRRGASPTFSPLYTSEFSEAMVVDGPSVSLQGTLFLEGPYQGSSMATGPLFQASIPFTQPYAHPDFDGKDPEYDGAEIVPAHPPGTIDWITLDLRNPPSPSTSAGSTVAFVRDDGQILGLDGSTQVNFYGVTPASYFVVACHRNHACAMSDTSVPFTPIGTFDFTLGNAFTTGPEPMKHLGGSVYGLFAADANADGQVQALDFNHYIEATVGGSIGYQKADFNLDGNVQALDFNLYIANTIEGASSQVP